MAKIYTVRNGSIFTLSESGGVLGSFRPSHGGNAIFVDYSPSLDRLLVTTDKGVILIMSTSGGKYSSFYATDAVMARWDGDRIIVQFRNGKLTRYSQSGGTFGSL